MLLKIIGITTRKNTNDKYQKIGPKEFLLYYSIWNKYSDPGRKKGDRECD